MDTECMEYPTDDLDIKRYTAMNGHGTMLVECIAVDETEWGRGRLALWPDETSRSHGPGDDDTRRMCDSRRDVCCAICRTLRQKRLQRDSDVTDRPGVNETKAGRVNAQTRHGDTRAQLTTMASQDNSDRLSRLFVRHTRAKRKRHDETFADKAMLYLSGKRLV